jgi:hypothetical protein
MSTVTNETVEHRLTINIKSIPFPQKIPPVEKVDFKECHILRNLLFETKPPWGRVENYNFFLRSGFVKFELTSPCRPNRQLFLF